MDKIKKFQRITSLFLTILMAFNINYLIKTSDAYKFYHSDKYFLPEEDHVINLDDVKSDYRYQDYYPTDEEIINTTIVSFSKEECKNEETDFDKLLDKIIKNSQKELSSLDNGDVIKGCLKNALLKSFQTPSDYKEDYCLLEGLKLKFTKLEQTTLAHYLPLKNTIEVDLEKVEKRFNESYVEGQSPETLEDYITNILTHEINHVRQHACACRLYQIYNILYNCGTYLYLFEACAESQVYNTTIENIDGPCNNQLFSYPIERDWESSLLWLAALKDNRNIDDYYRAIFDTDFQSLYNFFGLESKEDYIKFYKINYAIDALNKKSNYLSDYLQEQNLPTNEYKNEIGFTCSIDILKVVIEDLGTQINNGNINLDESIILFEYAKACLASETIIIETIEDDRYYYYDEVFLKDLVEIEDIYYQYIKDYFKTNDGYINEIKSNFKNYYTYELPDETIESTFNTLFQKFPILKTIEYNEYNAIGSYCYYFLSFYEENYKLERKR